MPHKGMLYEQKQPMRNHQQAARRMPVNLGLDIPLTKERSFFTVHSTFVLYKSSHD